jgi:bifunctional DNA-binding transcriptional regulator/antitoxin component of YhaV-PrlF toxin-antitoxin module
METPDDPIDGGLRIVATKLPKELRSEVLAHPGVPLELIDEQTQAAYVLLRAEEFQRLTSISTDDLSDTYAAQIESAMRSGWENPLMDEYNDYDTHLRQA